MYCLSDSTYCLVVFFVCLVGPKKKVQLYLGMAKCPCPIYPADTHARTHISYYHSQNTPLSLSTLIAAPPPSLLLITVATSKKMSPSCIDPTKILPPSAPLLYKFFSLLVFPILKKGRGGDRAPMIWLCITNPNYIIPSQDWLIKHCYLFDFL